MNQTIKRIFPRLSAQLHSIRERYYEFLGRHWPKYLMKTWYHTLYGERMDLDHPQDIDEKLSWLKLHADMSLWTRCADKSAVRSYVEERGLGFTLNEVYGVYERAEDIDFGTLPQSFVVKTTNGGGGTSVMIVKDKATVNIAEARRTLNSWLKRTVGYRYYEPHYIAIPPRLIIEKYLAPNAGEHSLVDYKFNCFNGQPTSVFLCSDRHFYEHVCYSIYDLDWHLYPEKMKPKYRTTKIYKRPVSFNRMVEYSKELSKDIPFVRVDWYEINGKPIFSEMTFTPGGGFQNFYTKDFRLELGRQLDLSHLS